uniref:NADH-ubiquinone oxidoreductase chain 3 n=1 Tax=Lasioderma serricorne TaxID=295660 RepID=A0A344BNW4_9COLE|nr:NADH dehydrogenase subunit 3 [Lasioderma serricorne]AUR43711.1 NADH dehydrogenase subunit 3 [Lasioderma serricorne]AWY13619.1 NADH dehydrogenase subunit 3 [Lasioderma serricorne]
MLLVYFFSILILVLCLLLMMINNLISKKSFMDREKSSPFECGFDPKCSSRMPFSLHFFLISIIFLVFDIEIALLLPFVIVFNMSNIISYMFLIIFFLFILLLGVYHEWNQGSLNWTM